ncbi:hypothetical protein JX266_010732 [Neoarthrinium moseri]|nr:hypothetical protein JX266_010732 [Neoarthrinium moseri]
MAAPETMPTAATTPPSTIELRAPSKYLTDKSQPATTSNTTFVSPPLDWVCRTWSVTHSTLPMWRSAINVRITYKPLAAPAGQATDNVDDLVEYEKKGSLKKVEGIDTPDPSTPGSWNWRGKGWLKIASSHWEVLGWGERPHADGVERWVVTWFAPTLFTKEGVDIYSDRKEGLSQDTLDEVMKALKGLDAAPKVVDFVSKDMLAVEIKLPWKTRGA